MYQQFTYEEARHLDQHRASHASDPTYSTFRRRRRLYRWLLQLRERARVQSIDLRTYPERGLDGPAHATRSQDRPVLPEFVDLTEVPMEPRIELPSERPTPATRS